MVIKDRPPRYPRQGPSCLFVLFFIFSMGVLFFVIQNADEVREVIIPTPTPEPTRSATEYALLADLSYNDGELEESVGYLETAVQLDATRPQLYIDLINRLIEVGRPQEALEWAANATLLDDSSPEIWNAYAAALLANGDRLRNSGDVTGAVLQYAEAADRARQALTIDPQNSTAMAYIAGGLVSQGLPTLYDPARVQAEEAVAIDPNNAIARYYLAQTYESLGRRTDALQQWQLGIQSDPGNPELYMGLAYNSFADGRIPDAILAFNQAIEVDPENAAAYDGLAFMYLQLGQHNLAQENSLIAIEKDPGMARAYGRLGEAYYLQNNYENAVEALTTATELYGEATDLNARFFYYLAHSYTRLGLTNCPQAVPYYEQVTQVFSLFQEAAAEGLVECRRYTLETNS